MILLIVFILSFNLFAQDTSKVLVKFSEPMNIQDCLNPANYIIKDNAGNNLPIYKVGRFPNIDSLFVVFAQRHQHKTNYKIYACNVRDKAGNAIDSICVAEYYFNGLLQRLGKPSITVWKEKEVEKRIK